MTPAKRVERILAEAVGSDLSSWEKFEFLPSVKQRTSLYLKKTLTPVPMGSNASLRGAEPSLSAERPSRSES